MYDLLLLETTDRDVICHVHDQARVLLIMLCYDPLSTSVILPSDTRSVATGTTGRDVTCHTLMEDILAKTVL